MLIKKNCKGEERKKKRIFHPVRILQTQRSQQDGNVVLLLSWLDMIIFLPSSSSLPFLRIRVCCVCPRPRITFYIYIYTTVVLCCIRNFWNVYFYFLIIFGFLFFGFDSLFSASSNFLSIHSARRERKERMWRTVIITIPSECTNKYISNLPNTSSSFFPPLHPPPPPVYIYYIMCTHNNYFILYNIF